MEDDEVLRVLALLDGAGAEVWVAGGWGVDALLGTRTRAHRDLDLLHRREQEPAVLAALAAAGYRESLDLRPVRFVVARPTGEEIDLHPLVFAGDGSARQSAPGPDAFFDYPAECFTTGTVRGTRVRCISVAQQIHFHQGYEPAAHDRADMARLRAAFGVATHF